MTLTPPKKNAEDAVHAIITAATGSIPLAGAASSELFKWLVTPSLERRRDEWMEAVAAKLREYEAGIGGLERLKTDEQFQDALIRASRIALCTSHSEKREALRNAVINSAMPNHPEALVQEMFLNFVDQMTVFHLSFLKLAQNPMGFWQQPMGNINSMIEGVHPSLRTTPEVYKYIWTDLVDKGLIKRIDMGAIGQSLLDKKTTSFGDRFLAFIENQ